MKSKSILNERYEINTVLTEGRMSHWINNFSIKDNLNKNIIIDLMNTNWDLVEAVEENNILKLTLRKYPNGRNTYDVKVDLENGIFEYKNSEYPIERLKEILDKIQINKKQT